MNQVAITFDRELSVAERRAIETAVRGAVGASVLGSAISYAWAAVEDAPAAAASGFSMQAEDVHRQLDAMRRGLG